MNEEKENFEAKYIAERNFRRQYERAGKLREQTEKALAEREAILVKTIAETDAAIAEADGAIAEGMKSDEIDWNHSRAVLSAAAEILRGKLNRQGDLLSEIKGLPF